MKLHTIELPEPTPEQQAYLDGLGGYMSPEEIKRCTCKIPYRNRQCPLHGDKVRAK